MGGGIFTGSTFVYNPKCIAFSFYSALLFAAGGGKNPLLITLIFIMSYVLLAWYDFTYECKDFMYSGTGTSPHFSSLLKPQYREKDRTSKFNLGKDEQELVADQEKAYLNKVYFFHSFLIAPMLMYVGYWGEQTNPRVWGLLGGMGGVAFMYHGFRLSYPREVWR
jgi:hypothetical protein